MSVIKLIKKNHKISVKHTTKNINIQHVGRRGLEGESAYQVAVDNGFVGTEVEWLASLKGEKGDPGDVTEAPVYSVNGKLGAVVLDKSDIGLSNADNTSDEDKPVSNATQIELDTKVDKEDGKGLSSNDYTSIEKSKLAGIPSDAEKNVNADWNANTGDAQILNKPVLGTAAGSNVSDFATASQGSKADSAVQPAQIANFETTTQLNARDTANRSRANHTGTQPISSITSLQAILDAKAGKTYVDTQDTAIANTAQTNLTAHTSRTDNPHNVTKTQVGLSNVDNTSDANKPISTATQTALNAKASITYVDSQNALDEKIASKGQAGGYASLDGTGKVPAAQLPSFVEEVLEYNSLSGFPTMGSESIIYVAKDTNKTYRWSGSSYIEISPSDVNSVNGKTGVVSLDKTDIGLSNVDNTSDLNKPISNAQSSVNSTKVEIGGDLAGSITNPRLKNVRKVFNVKDYGAVMDGVTDDSLAVRSAMIAAQAVGGEAYIPEGTLAWGTQRLVTQLDNVTLRGAGKGKTIIKRTQDNALSMLEIGRGSGPTAYGNIELTDITFDLNATGTGFNIVISWCYNVLIERCAFINPSTNMKAALFLGKFSGGSDGFESYNIRVNDCDFNYGNVTTLGWEYVGVINARDVEFSNCRWDSKGNTTSRPGVLAYNTEQFRLVNSFVDHARITVGGRGSYSVTGTQFEQGLLFVDQAKNIFIGGGTSFTSWGTTTNYNNGIQFKGGFKASTDPETPWYVTTDTVFMCENVVIDGVTFRGAKPYAIYGKTTTESSTQVLDVRNIIISNVTIEGSTGIPIVMYAKQIKINNVDIRNANTDNISTSVYHMQLAGEEVIVENVYANSTNVTRDIIIDHIRYTSLLGDMTLRLEDSILTAAAQIRYYDSSGVVVSNPTAGVTVTSLNANNQRIVNVATPTSANDAVNKSYVDTSVQNRMRVYDVRDYGAVANGTTNDAIAIKAAMDAANSAGGGIVQLMPGTHAFTASITGAYKNITVRGYPNVTICKATGSFTNGMFNFDANTTSSENIIIEDVMLDVNNQTNVHGVTIKGGTFASGAYAKNFTFRRVSAKNLLTVDIGLVTIYTGRGATDRGKVTDIKFIDCDFQETSKYHVFVIGGQAEDYRFTNCKFRNSQYGCIGINQPNKKNSANAIGTRSSKNWVIEGCTFTNNHLSSTALFAFLGGFTDSNRSGIRSLKFLNCRFEGNGDANTTIEQYAMSIHSSWDVIIQGCTFWKIRTFLNVGQSYNGPWYQEDGTQFLTIRDNTFYQLYNIVDHDSAFFATWDNNKFIEIFYWGIGGYSRHWPSVYTNNYFYNTPTDPSVSAERTGLFYIDGRDGFEVRNNIFIDDRKLANPTSAPTTSTVAGGAQGARTYYVKYVYRNDTGTTLASPSTTQAVAANSLLKFDFPYTATYGPPSGAKWVDIYVGTTSGSETLQTSQPVAWQQETETVLSQNFGPITWTEPTTGLVAGTALPSSNTTKNIAKYAIYEGDTEVGGPRYVNHYTGNRVYGMEFLRSNSSWGSIDLDNWYVPDLSVSSTAIESNPIITKNVRRVYNVKDYSAKGDGKKVTDAAITTGTAALTSATAQFSSSDVGKRVVLVGAGAAGVNLNTTISAYVSATQVTLATNASTTVSNASLYWGTNDAAAITSAYVAAANGGEVYFPVGMYTANTSITINKSGITTNGEYGKSILVPTSSTNPFLYPDGTGVGSSGLKDLIFRNIVVDCANQGSTSGIQVRSGNYATGDFIENIRFEYCKFLNTNGSIHAGIKFLSGRGTTDRGYIKGIYVDNCEFDGAKYYHIYFDGGQFEEVHITKSRFLNSIFSSIGLQQAAKNQTTGYIGVESNNIRSCKNWSLTDCYFKNPLSTANLVRDINKTGIRNFNILRNTFDVGYTGDPIYAYCISVEGGGWGLRIKDNTFWKAYKCLSIGQSNNGPWFQTNPTQMDEVSGNTFFQCYEIFDHDSDCVSNIHDNTFFEIARTPYNANYGRHSYSRFHHNTIINSPTQSGTGTQNAAILVSPLGQEISDNLIVDNRKLHNPTTAPVLSQVAGGTLSARTYYVKYTWENDTGETLGSNEASFSVSANNLLQITHTYSATYGPPEGAKRINWYVGTTTNSGTKQGYSWLTWAQEVELYPTTQQAISWTEPTTGLVSGAALPSSNTTKILTEYGIYELSGESEALMIYPNIYTNNKFMGLTANELYVGNAAYKRTRKNNWTMRDMTFGSDWALLEAIPYSKGNVTGVTTFNINDGETQTATITGNVTSTLSAGHYTGQQLERRFTMGGSGGYTYTKSSNERLAGGLFTPSNSAGSTDILIQEWDGTNWVEKKRIMGLA